MVLVLLQVRRLRTTLAQSSSPLPPCFLRSETWTGLFFESFSMLSSDAALERDCSHTKGDQYARV
mgnify:CR=1 FL=1|jgi:hypothetical protein